jgi:hypothetical protein
MHCRELNAFLATVLQALGSPPRTACHSNIRKKPAPLRASFRRDSRLCPGANGVNHFRDLAEALASSGEN